jgi:outer membrane cobalamin receptor
VAAMANPAFAQDEAPETPIVVLGDKLEESLPEKLADRGARLEILEGETIDQVGYNDISQALQMQVPGIYVAPKNGAFDYVTFSLLGSRTNEVLLLVDGVRLSNRLYATTTSLDTVPAHMVERIEVLKDGQGLHYGTQAVGGVINVISKAFTKEFDGAVEAGYDTNDGYHFNGYARGGSGDHYFVAYASRDEAEGFRPFRIEDYQPSSTDRRRSYELTTVGLKYAFEPSDAFRLSASWQHGEGNFDWATPEDAAFYQNSRNEEIASVKLDLQPAENVSIFVKGYWHDWDSVVDRLNNVLGPDGQPTGATTVISDAERWQFEDRGVNVMGEFRASENFTVIAGYDFQKYNALDEAFLIAPLAESVHAPFAQLNVDLGAARLSAGIRHNMPSDGQSSTVWNVSGKIDATDEIYVRGQVGTSFRLPDAYELYVVDPCCEQGNPNLVAEESFNTEFGIGYDNDTISGEVLGFYRTVDNLIGIDFDLPAYPDGFMVNTDDQTKLWGAELIVNARLSDVFGFTFDYTHTRAKFAGTTDQIQDIPKDYAKFIVSAAEPSGRFGGTVALNWVGDVYDSVAGGIGRVEHGNYLIADLSFFAFLDEDHHHRFGFRVENLFDKEYATRVTRQRVDVTNASYAAWNLGTPMTGHVTYQFRF